MRDRSLINPVLEFHSGAVRRLTSAPGLLLPPHNRQDRGAKFHCVGVPGSREAPQSPQLLIPAGGPLFRPVLAKGGATRRYGRVMVSMMGALAAFAVVTRKVSVGTALHGVNAIAGVGKVMVLERPVTTWYTR